MKKFQVYEQLDQMGYGYTCLQMVAKQYSRCYSLNDLKSKSFHTHKGVSLLRKSEAIGGISFETIDAEIFFENYTVKRFFLMLFKGISDW